MRIRKKQEELIEVVDREERKETLWYHFDDMTLRNGILYLRGWHVSVDGPGEVRLTDASGEERGGRIWKRLFRMKRPSGADLRHRSRGKPFRREWLRRSFPTLLP